MPDAHRIARTPWDVIQPILAAGTALAPSPRAKRRVFVNNGLALICLTLNVSFTLLFALKGLRFMVAKQLLMMAVYGFVIGLNRKGHFRLSKVLLFVTLTTSLFGSLLAFNLRQDVSLLYAAACLPLLMCDLEERSLLALGMTLPVVYALMLVTGPDLLMHSVVHSAPTGFPIRPLLVLATFAGLYSASLSFMIANARAEDRLESAHAGMRQLLDRIDQGIATLDRRGCIGPERSAMFDTWFSSPAVHTPFASCLAGLDPAAGRAFESSWSQLEGCRESPAEQLSLQLPAAVSARNRHYALQYKTTFRDQQFDGVMVVMTDVSVEFEKARSEEQRRALERDLALARKLEAVGQLAAGIAHEINTPAQYVGHNIHYLAEATAALSKLVAEYKRVIALLGDAPEHGELIAQLRTSERLADLEYVEENVPDACARAQEGMLRIAKIVSAMKEFAHPGNAEKRPADLNHALQIALTLAHSEYKLTADIETDLSDLPPVVCHLNDINQVFLNLLVNAAHAVGAVAEQRGARGLICVRTRVAPDAGTVRIEISDTGCGIPPEIQHRVFDPFFTTKEVGKGTGQGLAIARHIVIEKHSGSLTFESTVGEGTTFSVVLPIEDVARDQAHHAA